MISDKKNLVARYAGKPKFLLQFIDMLENTNRYNSIIIYAEDKKKLIKDFESLFEVVKAAGGLVFNKEQEALMIFRRGYWDLPKGKMEKGESKRQSAKREVKEETGLKKIKLKDFIYETNHFYRNRKNQRCIKRTYWYEMYTEDTELIPQTEEDIEKAVWTELNNFLEHKPKIYKNILDVIENHKKA